MNTTELPIPPLEMRQLVGPTDPAMFDNPSGELVHPYLPEEVYEAVLDFGCGCGRVARQLIQQQRRPVRYLGIDLHRGMIEWCRQNLAPQAPGFEFAHHDVQNTSFNPGPGKPEIASFPAPDDTVTLVEAISVFTHVVERHVAFYLREVARVLRPDGVLNATWFLFDKRDFPMMQDFQNALYINDLDPWNAVIFDRAWLREQAAEARLTISSVGAPHTRGFQWTLLMTPVERGLPDADFPADDAPEGRQLAPLLPPDAARIGLDR